MKKIISLVLTIVIALSLTNVSFAEPEYATRMDALNMLFGSLESLPESDGEMSEILDKYEDTKELTYEEKRVLAYAVNCGLITGYPDGTIKPYDTITRGALAVILKRCYEKEELNISKIEKVTDYNIHYPDVKDWNFEGVKFCVEHAIMIGHGDIFGCDDKLAKEQLEIISSRLKYSSVPYADKYRAILLNEAVEFDFNALLETGMDEKVKLTVDEISIGTDCWITSPELLELYKQKLQSKGWDDVYAVQLADGYEIIYEMENIVKITKNFDYEDYPDEDCKRLLAAKILQLTRDDDTIENILDEKMDDYLKTEADAVLKNIQTKIDNNVKVKSFFVAHPYNVYNTVFTGLSSIDKAKGFEYFIYYSGDKSTLPEGVEIGKWYRREKDMSSERLLKLMPYIDKDGNRRQQYNLSYSEEYSAPEPVPEYLFKK